MRQIFQINVLMATIASFLVGGAAALGGNANIILLPGQDVTVSGTRVECQLTEGTAFEQYLTLKDDAILALASAGKIGQCAVKSGLIFRKGNGTEFESYITVGNQTVGGATNVDEYSIKRLKKWQADQLRGFIRSGVCAAKQIQSSAPASSAEVATSAIGM